MGITDRFRTIVAAMPKPELGVKFETNPPEGESYVDPIGAAGTSNYDGYLTPDEYNQTLAWPQSLDVWERMRRSDPAVREALWHFNAPLMAAVKTIEPPDDADDLELEVTEFVRCALFEWMDQPFEEFLQSLMTFLPMGHSVFEPVKKVVTKSIRIQKRPELDEAGNPIVDVDEDGPDANLAALPPKKDLNTPPATNDEKSSDPAQAVPVPQIPPPELVELPPRLFVTLRKMSIRLPKTIVKWNVDRAGDLVSITQQAPVSNDDGSQTYEEITIRASELVVFVNEKWGDEWMGTSILRAAYKPWVLKEVIEKTMGIAYERHGVGIPVGYIPRDREGDTALMDEMETKLTNLRAGEFSYLLFPGPKSTGNMPGFDFEIVSPGGSMPDFEKALTFLRGEIKGALLIRFSELGHGQTGARATSQTQSEVWYAALNGMAHMIAGQMNTLIRRLVDINYPGVERYPTLKFSGIKERNLLEFAQAVALLANAEMIHADSPTRAWVRSGIDAPDEDADEAGLRAQQQAEQQAMEKASTAGVFDVEEDPAETARPRTSKTNTPD